MNNWMTTIEVNGPDAELNAMLTNIIESELRFSHMLDGHISKLSESKLQISTDPKTTKYLACLKRS